MMMEDKWYFEVLVLDVNGKTNITKEDSLIDAISYSEELWSNKEVVERDEKKCIYDRDLEIELQIFPINTDNILSIESSFLIRVKGVIFEKIERFRHPFLIHLKRKLEFTNTRILRDDISTKISNEIYPLINKIENILRRYLVLFFTQKIGHDWWDVTAPNTLAEKTKLRKNNEKLFTPLVDTDLTLIDFDDLGELIYKQTSGFNNQENIIARVMETNDLENLELLKLELKGNYTKYFKEAFQNNQFDKKWKKLFEIRNKVAHNNLFAQNDLNIAIELVEDLQRIIDEAESSIENFNFSIEEKEAIFQAQIEAIRVRQSEDNNKTREKELEDYGLTVVGKINLEKIHIQANDDNDYEDDFQFKVITQDILLKELQYAEKSAVTRGLTYVGLKVFVTKLLGNKGYAFGPTYSLVNILKDKGLVELYDIYDEGNIWQAKAIKLTTPSLL